MEQEVGIGGQPARVDGWRGQTVRRGTAAAVAIAAAAVAIAATTLA